MMTLLALEGWDEMWGGDEGEEVIGLDVTARIDKLRAELAKIPNITGEQAEAMTAKLNRELRTQTAAIKKAAGDNKKEIDKQAAATKKAVEEFEKLNGVAEGIGRSSTKMAGALGLIDSAAADAARNVADFADVGELAVGAGEALGVSAAGTAAALGVLTTAAVAGYIAWRVWSEDAERAEQTSKMVSAALAAQQPILDATRDATDRLRLATGELTEKELALERASRGALAAFQQSTAGTRKEMAALRSEQSSWTTTLVDFAEAAAPKWTAHGAILDGLTTSSEEYQGQIDALNGTMGVAIEHTAKLADASTAAVEAEAKAKRSKDAITAANKTAADAERALVAAMRESQQALDEDTRAAEGAAAGIAALQAARDAGLASTLTGTDAVIAAHEREIDALERQYQAVIKLTSTDAERIAATQAYQEAQLATTAATMAKLEQLYTKDAEAAAASEEKKLVDAKASEEKKLGEAKASQAALGSASVELLNLMSEAAAESAAKVGSASKESARRAWLASKGLALAAAGVATYQAAATALATPPAPNIPLAAITVALGLAQVGKIAATEPSFGDTPGPMKMKGGGSVRLAAGDYFAAAQKPEDLRQQVGGGAPASVRVVVQQRHEVFDLQMLESARSRGSEVSRLLGRINGSES